jgi:DNA-binding beta-propeller fold protein YncE
LADSLWVKGSGAPTRVSLLVAFLLTIAVTMVFAVASAQAGEIHIFGGSFGSKGTGAGQFEEPTGIAVSDITHDVYVADSANNRVEYFTAEGAYVGEFNGSGLLAGEVIPAPTGQFSSPGGPSGIAVDNSGKTALEDPSVGDVYVIDRGHHVIDKFSENGAYLGQLTGTCPSANESEPVGTCEPSGVPVTPFDELEGVAVDQNGVLWVSQGHGEPQPGETQSGLVDSFSDATANESLSTPQLQGSVLEFILSFSGKSFYQLQQGFAVNSEDALYPMFTFRFSEGDVGRVVEFNSAGEESSSTPGGFNNTGVAVDLATNEVYTSSATDIEAFSAENAPIETFGSGHLTGGTGVAVDASNSTVYVTDSTSDAVEFFDEVPVPDVTTEPPSNVLTTSVTLKGTVNPVGTTLTSCEFEYGSEAGSYTHTVKCSPAAGAITGTEPVAVEANVSGLTRYTTYHYRLVAANKNGSLPSLDAELLTGGAGITSESVSDVTASSAMLEGRVDPNGLDTRYYFQYATESTEGCVERPSLCVETPVAPGTDLGAAMGIQSLEQHIQKLQPGTTYHYRVVTVQGSEVFAGPDRMFMTQALGSSLLLPDGRVWELVSPANKDGGQVFEGFPERGVDLQASEDGKAVTYVTTAPVGAGQSSPLANQILSVRGPDGWSSQNLDTGHEESSSLETSAKGGALAFFSGEYVIFSPDLSLAYVDPEGHTPLAGVVPAGNNEPYVRDNSTGTFTQIKVGSREWYAEQVAHAQGAESCDPSASPAKGEGVHGVSRDGCYVYFNSESILAPGAVGPDPLYVSHYEGGQWSTTFISSLSGRAPEWGHGEELSPNGRYLAFMSEASLTGYDNEDVTSRSAGERIDEEVFLYDAATNHLVCASCDPTGARPAGVLDGGFGRTLVDSSDEWTGHWLAASVPNWVKGGAGPGAFAKPIYEPRYAFDEGRLFFDSPDRLVPQHVDGLENVYEYEPQGTNCSKGAGCVSLISSGTGSQESALVDASASGNDVFFMTSSRLVSQDYDTNYDMYDAHVCSANVPCLASSVAPPPCETGDSCKAAPAPQPAIFGAPPSATFVGAGNVTPAPATVTSKKAKKRASKCAKAKKRSRKKCKRSNRRAK